MELTKEAKRALVNAWPPRKGGRVYAPAVVLADLLERGLVTRSENLTDRGVAARQRILDEMLEAL